MADFPAYAMPAPPVLTPFHPDSLGLALTGAEAGAAGQLEDATSGTWGTANRAFYYPFKLYAPAVATQLLFFVGAASAGNIDVGIYTAEGSKIVSSGSTAMSATVNTVQELNITDTALPPGEYLLAVVCSSTSGSIFRINNGDEVLLPAILIYEEDAALPLPAMATPVVPTATTVPIAVVGIQFASAF